MKFKNIDKILVRVVAGVSFIGALFHYGHDNNEKAVIYLLVAIYMILVYISLQNDLDNYN